MRFEKAEYDSKMVVSVWITSVLGVNMGKQEAHFTKSR